MPFWKKKPTVDPEIETYFRRSRNFIEVVAETMEAADQRLQESNGDVSSVESLRYRIDHSIKQLEWLEPPTSFPLAAQHKENYLALMRLSLRKFDDIVYNGAANIEALLAEEDALYQKAQREAEGAIASSEELRRQYGGE